MNSLKFLACGKCVYHESPLLLEELRSKSEGISFSQPAMIYQKHINGLLRKDKKPGFETPSGKFEITSTLLAKYGYHPFPAYQEPIDGPSSAPELAQKYPLILTTGTRIQSTFRSQHLNIPGLLKL